MEDLFAPGEIQTVYTHEDRIVLDGAQHRGAHEEAVISPSWSVHSGAGTHSYTFVWAMDGENQAYDDMDPVAVTELR